LNLFRRESACINKEEEAEVDIINIIIVFYVMLNLNIELKYTDQQ